MRSDCVVFFVCFLFLEDLLLVRAENVWQNPTFAQNIQDQCNAHCSSVIRPIIEASDELKNKVISLENAVRDVRSQLESSKTPRATEDSHFGEKKDQIKPNSEGNSNDPQLEQNSPNFCPIGSQAGTYSLKLQGIEPFRVAKCSPTASGWIAIQRRLDGSVNFNRTWLDYQKGFGDISGEFFIGLERLHLMTQEQPHELFIQLRQVNGDTVYAHFEDFQVGSEREAYKLELVGEFSGTAEDSLKYHLGKKFSTFDRDNDESGKNCAAEHGGGWWFHSCLSSSLNGLYFRDGETLNLDGIHWGRWKYQSFTFVQMMIRPKLF